MEQDGIRSEGLKKSSAPHIQRNDVAACIPIEII